jgi:rhodanese-related sulfurtransferase
MKDKPILVYCRSGNRSIPASQILSRNGFKKIYNLQNGINGWMKDDLPVERQQ